MEPWFAALARPTAAVPSAAAHNNALICSRLRPHRRQLHNPRAAARLPRELRAPSNGVRALPQNIQCVRTSSVRAWTTIWFVTRPNTTKEVRRGDGMRVGSAPTADHVRGARGRLGRGVEGPDLAARPRALPAMATRRGRWSRQGRSRGLGGGGLHRLALRGRGDTRRGLRRALGRARGYAGGAWSQASSQDRPNRRGLVARVVAVGRPARELDPARDRVGVAGAGAALPVAGQPEHGVVAAVPRQALPARAVGPGGG